MHLAILVTNTDFSAFARARPLDDAKFASLIEDVRPAWSTTAFWVCRDEFPESYAAFDGVVITGSPASVNDGARWMEKLEHSVRDLVAAGVPIFGACFGHQIIAKALGARITRNPHGWSHGLIDIARVARMDWSGSTDRLALYGSHIEQVAKLPDGARRVFESPGCPIAGFAIGRSVFTVQHHPEMTKGFIIDLIGEYADHVGAEVTEQARRSVADRPADSMKFAGEIARFFEHARQ
ncbi:type 1 glutamine amidotransferase [Sulfitobacter albidus]|uniref:Type 1 glutamine amidotransferase n=1 Tax=Sulfitobacter albidus TaxID=2829501 RepID=A0A975JGX5_9RHOB|nr:type 1 glutamine amidotransferase [Sulfitobacter albidus]QUJ78253.1 type 1 glutamine amidotransferase [Sulfitobacter albidus]